MPNDLPEVIDCHIHPFLTAASNTSWFPGCESAQAFSDELKRAGIDRWCGAPIRPLSNPTREDFLGLNKEMLALWDFFGDDYIPAANIHPAFPDDSCAALETLHARGVRWVGELVAYMTGYKSYDTPAMHQILDLAQQLEMVVNIHPFELGEIGNLCVKFPKLSIVLAHPTGGRATIQERFDFLSQHSNAYLDLSGSGLFRWGMLRAGIDQTSAERFLFGTDFPICNPKMLLEAVRFEHLNDGELEKVLAGNFRRLTGI